MAISNINRIRRDSILNQLGPQAVQAIGGRPQPPPDIFQMEMDRPTPPPNPDEFVGPPERPWRGPDEEAGGTGGVYDPQNAPQLPTGTEPSAAQQTRYEDLYTPETRESERFIKLLDEAPEREKPSFMRKLTASMVGLKGGVKGADEVLDAPYRRAKEEWETKATPFYQSANLEKGQNQVERQFARDRMLNEQAVRKIEETERSNKSKEEIANAKLEIQRTQNATFFVRGTDIIALYKDGRAVPTGVKTTNFSPLEIENLRQSGRLKLEEVRHTGDMAEIGARGAQDRLTKQTEPAFDPNRTSPEDEVEDPAKLRMRRNNAMRKLYDNPKYRDFIQPGESSTDDWTFTEAPKAGRFWGGATPEEIANYVQMMKDLENEMKITTPPVRIRPQAVNTPTNEPSLPIGTEVGTDLPRLPDTTGASYKEPAGGTFKFNTPSPAGLKFQTPITAQGRNQKTGETGTIVSYDGGKTWQPLGK